MQKSTEKTTFPPNSGIMHIGVIGAGKSATVLIDYLQQTCVERNWQLSIGDANVQMVQSKIRTHQNIHAVALKADDAQQRNAFIRSVDLVISMLPPALHILVAEDCLRLGKHLLTASYVDDALKKMADDVKASGLIFLCEMGLDPGIDHMSAMQLIDRIHNAGGKINAFYSHCGGLIAPESDNNPWHYKISWNPRNIVLAGKSGAVYRENKQTIQKPYPELFNNAPTIVCKDIPLLEWYPNRDSLSYIPLYGLEQASTFIRTTLRYQHFCCGWHTIAAIGLTDTEDQALVNKCNTFRDWIREKLNASLPKADRLSEYVTLTIPEEIQAITLAQLSFLNLDAEEPIPHDALCSADLLQKRIESRLALEPTDKDMIVMLHEIEYTTSDGQERKCSASLVVKGEDHVHTAMAKTVGLPLAIAAELILTGKIHTSGLQIPTSSGIYEPVLEALSEKGIRFTEQDEEVKS